MRAPGAPLVLATSVALAASVALVAGCGDASGHARPDVPHPFGAAAHIPAADRKLFAAAEERLVAACMHGRGMPYLPEPPAADTGADGDGDGAAIYGLIAPRDARLHGYGLGERRMAAPTSPGTPSGTAPADGDLAAPPGANDAARKAMTGQRRRDWDRALLGSPGREVRIEVEGNVFTYRADGCVTIARHRLFGQDWDRLRITAQVAVNAVTRRVWHDPAVTVAVAGWSGCMRGEGHDFDGPAAPRAAVEAALSRVAAGDRAAFSAALRLEHATAIADADCQRDSGLWEAIATAQGAAESAIPRALAEAVSSFRAAREQALGAAHRTVRA